MVNLLFKFHVPNSKWFCSYQKQTDKYGQFSYDRVFLTLHSTEVLTKNVTYFFNIYYHVPAPQYKCVPLVALLSQFRVSAMGLLATVIN
jgi:hypothetical protein